jgi:HK97 family phage major capsid protein
VNLRQILEKRNSLKTEMLGLLAKHPAEMPAEAAAAFAGMQAEADQLVVAEQRHAAVQALETRQSAVPLMGGNSDSFDAAASLVTAMDVIRAQLGYTDVGAGRARDVSNEIAKRSNRDAQGLFLPTDARRNVDEKRAFSLSGGAGLVQTDINQNLIDILRNKSVVKQLGATVMSGLQGNVAVPRLAASASVAWFLDATGSVSYTAPTIDQITMSPHHVGGVVTVSRSLVQQSSPGASQIVENDLGALIATAIDQAALSGTGSAGVPLGVTSAAISTVYGGANGAALSWANIQALVSAVDVSNALGGKLGFATNGLVVKAARTILKTSTDSSSNFILDTPGMLAGYMLANTQNIGHAGTRGTGTGLSTLVFGDWSSVVIAEWSALDLLVNPYSAAAYPSGSIDIRAMASIDIGIRHLLSFAMLPDIIA